MFNLKKSKTGKFSVIAAIAVAFLAVAVIVSVFGKAPGFEAYAAGTSSTAGTTGVNGSINSFSVSEFGTGASIALRATAEDSNEGAVTSLAEAASEYTVTIQITDVKLLAAIASGRVYATLKASGTNAFNVTDGFSGEDQSALITVSGAMNGSAQTASSSSYSGTVIAARQLLSVTPDNTISVNFAASYSAFDNEVGIGGTSAAVSLACDVTSISVLLEFQSVSVTLRISAGGTVSYTESVSSASGSYAGNTVHSLSLGYDAAYTYTAVPAPGYYFAGWVSGSTTSYDLHKELANTVQTLSSASYDFTATFTAIPVSAKGTGDFVYQNVPLGPSSGFGNPNFKIAQSYTGTVNDASSSAYNSASLPVNAGNYVYTVTISFQNDEVAGSYTENFRIIKDTPVLSVGLTKSVTLKYGQTLEWVSFGTVAAANSRRPTETCAGSLVIVTAYGDLTANSITYTAANLLNILAVGAHSYSYIFVPSGANAYNYNAPLGALTATVEDSFSARAVNPKTGTAEFSVSKTVATSVDTAVVNNVSLSDSTLAGSTLKISLTAADLSAADNYFFLGWRYYFSEGGNYAYLSNTSAPTLRYDYYLPLPPKSSDFATGAEFTAAKAEYDEFLVMIFEAFFLLDTTAAEGTVTKAFNGKAEAVANRFTVASVDDERESYFGDATYATAAAPTVFTTTRISAIGNHFVKYDVKSPYYGTVVATRTLSYNITENTVVATLNATASAANGGYNAPWARNFYFTLKVPGLATAGNPNYWYSTDGGSSWTKITTGSVSASTDKLYTHFITPSIDAGTSQILNYTLKATDPLNDGTVWARNNVALVCPTDNTTPVITNIQFNDYTPGSWSKTNVSVTATVSFGSSGAIFYYSYSPSMEPSINVSGISFNQTTGDGSQTGYVLNFTLSKEGESVVYFGIKGGSGNKTASSGYALKIDLTAPSIGAHLKDMYPDAGKWINKLTTFTFSAASVVENGSGLDSFVCLTDTPIIQFAGAAYTLTETLAPGLHYVREQSGTHFYAFYNPVALQTGVTLSFSGSGQNAVVLSDSGVTLYTTYAGTSQPGKLIYDGANQRYTIKVGDSREYVFRATDVAGNYTEYRAREEIDITVPVIVDYQSGSYEPGTWIYTLANLRPLVSNGGSGVKLYYSTNAGSTWTAYIEDFSGGTPDDPTFNITDRQIVNFSFDVYPDVLGLNAHYMLKVENRAGLYSITDFGDVLIDLAAPVFDSATDLSPYQAVWTSSTVPVTFNALDNVAPAQLSSGIARVEVNGGATVTNTTGAAYTFTIEKYFEYVVTIFDNAGNSASRTFLARVDTIDPTLEIAAYIGGGNPQDISVAPSAGDYPAYDFTQWITSAVYPEPWIRFEFTINLTASGSRLQYSNSTGAQKTWYDLTGTFLPEGDALTGTVSTRTYITEEQNKIYFFRLATGSGKTVVFNPVEGGDAYVKIDSHSPVLTSSYYQGGGAYTITENWTYQSVLWRMRLADTFSGINASTVSLLAYAYSESDAAILAGTATPLQNYTSALVTIAGGYEYTLRARYKYLLSLSDNAGNPLEKRIVCPWIDLTDNVSVTSVTALVGGSAYRGEYWLLAEENVLFTVSVQFDTAKGVDFGESGGSVKFSTDGGATWITSLTFPSGAVQSLGARQNGTGDGNYYYQMTASADQVRNYIFCVATGAGYYSYYKVGSAFEVFPVLKDNAAAPNISSVVAKYTDGTTIGADYNSDWIKGTVTLTVNVSGLGASGGILYYGAASDFASVSSWINLKTLAEGDSATNLTLANSVNSNYYFKVIRGKTGAAELVYSAGVSVKIDKEPISAYVKGLADGISVVPNGGWSHSDIVLSPVISSIGASGVGRVYYSLYNSATSAWGGYVEMIASEGVYSHSVSTVGNLQNAAYRMKIVSVSGIEFVTESYSFGIDKDTPAFIHSASGTKLAGNFAGWYISNVTINYTVSTTNISGVRYYYAYAPNVEGAPGEYTDWIESASPSFVLTDPSVKGGSDRYYKFSVRSGAGLYAEYTDIRIPIDTCLYTVSFSEAVGTVSAPSAGAFASASGAGNSYQRGDNVFVGITPLAGYYYDEVTVLVGGNRDDTSFYYDAEDRNNSPFSHLYVISADIQIQIQLFRAFTLTYSDTAQYIQGRTVTPVGLAVSESGFSSVFGNISTSLASVPGQTIRLNVTYTDSEGNVSSSVPSAIGVYTIRVEISGSQVYYIINNPLATLTIVYFSGAGTQASPYLIGSQTDLAYIDAYMYWKEEYASLDKFGFLGANRRRAYFLQTADITLNASFRPLGAPGADYTQTFKGTYNGGGKVIKNTSTFVLTGDFAIFLNIENAAITQLGVELRLRSLNDGATVGYIVGNAVTTVSGAITYCYASGDLEIAGHGVVAGGIAASVEGTLVAHCFSDVKMAIGSDTRPFSGKIGGAVGSITDSYTEQVYSIGGMSVANSLLYSPSLPDITYAAYAGAVIGYAETSVLPHLDNYFLKNNLSVDGSVMTALALGNQETFLNSMRLVFKTIDFFMDSSAAIISYGGSSKTVKELTAVRIDGEKQNAGMEGSGTTEDPFLVDNATKFAYIEVFPWAAFLQTANITFAPSDRSAYCTLIPFVGRYDGGGYSISGIAVDLTGVVHGGLFGVLLGTVRNLRIIDAELIYEVSTTIYAGSLVGVAYAGSFIQNITASGKLTVYGGTGTVYAGGIVGLADGAAISDCISLVSVTIKDSKFTVAGGIAGQVQGESSVSSAAVIAAVTASYSARGSVGSAFGALASSGVAVSGNIYSVSGITYVNGTMTPAAVAYNISSGGSFSAASYEFILTRTVGSGAIGAAVSGLYPFAGGVGTPTDPFHVSSYSELLMIGNYMYASFILTDDIVIGDYDKNGVLNAADGYKYDFSPIGAGSIFTGTLSGTLNQRRHSITGLTAALFETLGGTVSGVTLGVSYKVFASENDIPEGEKIIDGAETYYAASVCGEDEDVVYGAVAQYNRGGRISSVNIEGEISIRMNGRGKLRIGSVVGVDLSGTIAGVNVSVIIDVRGYIVEAGGIIGSAAGSAVLEDLPYNHLYNEMRVSGFTVSAGILAGAVKGADANNIYYQNYLGKIPSYVNSAELIINGDSYGTTQYIGRIYG